MTNGHFPCLSTYLEFLFRLECVGKQPAAFGFLAIRDDLHVSGGEIASIHLGLPPLTPHRVSLAHSLGRAHLLKLSRGLLFRDNFAVPIELVDFQSEACHREFRAIFEAVLGNRGDGLHAHPIWSDYDQLHLAGEKRVVHSLALVDRHLRFFPEDAGKDFPKQHDQNTGVDDDHPSLAPAQLEARTMSGEEVDD